MEIRSPSAEIVYGAGGTHPGEFKIEPLELVRGLVFWGGSFKQTPSDKCKSYHRHRYLLQEPVV